MSMVEIALRRPYTFIVMAMLIVLATPFALLNMATDIFPEINIPVISVIWNYNGLSAQEMGQRIAGQNERGLTTTVSDIEHIESTSLAGITIIKIFFQPTANIQTAIAQVVAAEQTQVRQLPPGITPPLVIKYSASSIPVVQLGLSSPTLPEQALQDAAVNVLRPQLITIPGVAVPFPYGGKNRLISVDLDGAALQARGLSPADVVNAVNVQNLILPSGTAKFGETEYTIRMNGSPDAISGLNDLPVRTINGTTTYLRDVAFVRDGFSPQTNVVRPGRCARRIAVGAQERRRVDARHHVEPAGTLPRVAATLPKEITITPLFDQSVFVKAAINGVVAEALIAAVLTAMMVLLFLGNWRSTLIIALTIPLSILASILALQALGETLNLMTLGGLALSVGILVDQAIVTIENIERHLHMGTELKQAILDGARRDRRGDLRLDAVHLHRVRADVLPDRRRALPVRAAGRGGGVRDDRLVHPVAHAGADAGHAADGQRAQARRRQTRACCSASIVASTRGSNGCARATRWRCRRCLARRKVFAWPFLAFCVAVVPALPRARPRFLSQRRCRPDPPAHARRDRHAHRGDGAPRRRGRGGDPRSGARPISSRPSSTISACPTAASTSRTATPAPSARSTAKCCCRSRKGIGRPRNS